MDRETRSRIQRATQEARRLLEDEFGEQLEGTFDLRLDGTIADAPGPHLNARQRRVRERLVEAVAHRRAMGERAVEAVEGYRREAAFTTLNRFVALKMLEARGLVLPCVSQGELSAGFREFTGLAPGLVELEDHGYRLFIESLFDEIGREVRVLFDRRDPASLLWPRRSALERLLEILNTPELAGVWGQDETIGWVYQYFNGDDERREMRAASQAPRNSRELAVRNQFFTPRYVVEFLTDNTLGRTWYEMRRGETALRERCKYLVWRPDEVWLDEGQGPPEVDELNLEEGDQPVHVRHRPKKDPRDLRILDPACGSGHFLLYAFDLLLVIYREAWADAASPPSQATGRSLWEDYRAEEQLRRALPGLILQHNLWGIDIDPRAAQIAGLALWMRAQRAFNEFDMPREERTSIARTGIVVAEPMPGERELLHDFCEAFPRDVATFVETIFDELKMAGEAGALLKIGDSVDAAIGKLTPGWGGMYSDQDQERWSVAETAVLQALRDYAEGAANGKSFRRRMFSDDAAQGLAFIDACRRTYDVVLMNPPFGVGSPGVEQLLADHYPNCVRELASAFVERASSLVHADGRIGVIATRKPFFIKSYARWREVVLRSGRSVRVLADLGRGVLDATVEAAAYVIDPAGTEAAWCARCFDDGMVRDDVDEALVSAIHGHGPVNTYTPNPAMYALIPHAPLAYWAEKHLVAAFAKCVPFEAEGRDASSGASTNDDFRFLRLWVEVPAQRLGRSRHDTQLGGAFVPIAKGGEYAPYYRDVELVVNWADDGRELKSYIADYRGSRGWGYHWSAALNGHDDYFRRGITWSRRTSTWLSARVLPAGCIFGDKGPAAFVPLDDTGELLHVLAWLNSSSVGALLALSTGKEGAIGTAQSSSYEVGIVERLPYVPPQGSRLSSLAMQAFEVRRDLAAVDELSRIFRGWREVSREHLAEAARAALDLQAAIDDEVAERYGADVANEEIVSASRVRTLDPGNPYEPLLRFGDPDVAGRVSWIFGMVMGRFDVRAATGERRLPPVPGPFEPLAACPPSMLAEDDLPLTEAPRGYPTGLPDGGILVDDPGHASDLLSRLGDTFEVVYGESAHHVLDETVGALDEGAADLRSWLRKSFFEEHIRRYSRSRRKAPIYWRLGTPSGSYSVWVYYHRFTRDTLHRVLHDYAVPKLQHEERRLTELAQEGGSSPTASQRKAIATQEAFVTELRSFRDELKRVAPLWNPDLDDGVILNFAPLWRLVGHTRSWQKECQKAWDKLVEGEYDWSHIAMHLWPERVVPKCAEDRSFAIAHGLEDVFWIEGDDGKWEPRAVDDATVARLVAERSSKAVQAARDDLLRAPAPAGGSTGRRRRS